MFLSFYIDGHGFFNAPRAWIVWRTAPNRLPKIHS